MRFEREKDIPAFKNKNWQEKIELRDQAQDRDGAILWLEAVSFAVCLVAFSSLYWIARLCLHLSPFVGLFVSAMLYSCVAGLFRGLFITPRIRKALESDAQSSA